MKKDFKKQVKKASDQCGITEDELHSIHHLHHNMMKQAGIDGAKAGEYLRNALLKLKAK